MNKLMASIVALAAATGAQAAPVQWTGAGSNGHYYDFVAAGDVSWTAAAAAAQTASPIAGHNSYLATITSAGENAFLAALSGNSGWLGGSDAGNPVNNWTWRGGPEIGQAFTYTNWGGGEPNNCCGGEDYLQFNFGGSGVWNDLQGPPTQSGFIAGYFVEYSLANGVPEPAQWALMLGGFGLLGAATRRRRSATVFA